MTMVRVTAEERKARLLKLADFRAHDALPDKVKRAIGACNTDFRSVEALKLVKLLGEDRAIERIMQVDQEKTAAKAAANYGKTHPQAVMA